MVNGIPDKDSTSIWQATAEMMVPGAELPRTADVVVIGGGLLGVWTAYWLARGGASPVLLEATAIGYGATGRNGGFLRGGTAAGFSHLVETVGRDDALALEAMSAEGARLASEVIWEERIDCDFRTPGTLALALSADELAAMRAEQSALAGTGFAGQPLDRADVARMIRTSLAEEIAGGTFYADGALLHSLKYLTGIVRAAERLGARFIRAQATGLAAADGGAVRVETDGGRIEAGSVVVALNAWSDALLPSLAGRIAPVRGQILAYAPIDPVFDAGIFASITPTGEYWQQTPDGAIVIGGCRADAAGGDVGVRELAPTPEVLGRIDAVLPRLFPALAGLRVARAWAGPMAFTSDHIPVAGAVPDLPNAWLCGGFCGHGMPFGPRVGQLLAEAVSSGRLPAALGPVRLDRPSLHPAPWQ